MISQVLILNKEQIAQKITRIAWQILEDNLDEKELIIAGIWERGYRLAARLKEILQTISALNITLVRIDLSGHEEDLTGDRGSWENKVVILVDDVLNSGKTMAYGLNVIMKTPHKKVRTAVLVDRSHKIFPIATDFVGLQLATVLKEHVDVVLDEPGEDDRVYLS